MANDAKGEDPEWKVYGSVYTCAYDRNVLGIVLHCGDKDQLYIEVEVRQLLASVKQFTPYPRELRYNQDYSRGTGEGN